MAIDPNEKWPDPNCAWNRSDSPRWREAVYALTWQPRLGSDNKILDYVLAGDCPRCGHPMNSTAGVAGVLKEGIRLETVRCNCEENTHSARPDGEQGCGQRGNIPLP